MVNRPFIGKRIDELEQLFKSSGTQLLTLNALESELVHRSTPRAVSLLKTVRKSLSLPEFKDRSVSPSLFDPQSVLPKAADSTPHTRTGPSQNTSVKVPQPTQPLPASNRTILPHDRFHLESRFPSRYPQSPKP
jgi:hypothetical protein